MYFYQINFLIDLHGKKNTWIWFQNSYGKFNFYPSMHFSRYIKAEPKWISGILATYCCNCY